MNILLKSRPSVGQATISELFIDNEFECFTMEDVVRPEGEKVYGQTAIPGGNYKIIINRSNRFSNLAGHDVFLPLLLDVPGFEGVRIHSGNKPSDTEGCLLPGNTVSDDSQFVYNSKAAFGPLFDKIQSALDRGEEVWIEVKRAMV